MLAIEEIFTEISPLKPLEKLQLIEKILDSLNQPVNLQKKYGQTKQKTESKPMKTDLSLQLTKMMCLINIKENNAKSSIFKISPTRAR